MYSWVKLKLFPNGLVLVIKLNIEKISNEFTVKSSDWITRKIVGMKFNHGAIRMLFRLKVEAWAVCDSYIWWRFLDLYTVIYW